MGYLQAKAADRRLKTQLEYEERQRHRDRVLAVKEESINHLGNLLKSATDLVPAVVVNRARGETIMDHPLYSRVFGDMQRAQVSMIAIDEQEIIGRLLTVSGALNGIILGDGELKDLTKVLTDALAPLENDYTELKIRAIGDS